MTIQENWLEEQLDKMPDVPKETEQTQDNDYAKYADDYEEPAPSQTTEEPQTAKPAEQPKPDSGQSPQGQQPNQQEQTTQEARGTGAGDVKLPIPRRFVKEYDSATGRTTLNDGTVLSSAAAVRIYSKGLNAAQSIEQATRDRDQFEQQNQQLRQQLETTQQSIQAITNSELSSADIGAAVQIYKELRADPKAALQKMLTQAQINGIVLDNANGSALDPNAIKHMIQEQLRPLTAPVQQQQEAQQRQQEFQQAQQQFFSKYEHADQHWPEIEALAKSNKLPVVDVYYRLKDEYRESGMDWSKPFNDPANQEAYQRRFGPPQQQPAPQPSNHLPPHTASNGTGRTAVPQQAAAIDNPDASIDDIVRDVMKRNGYNW